MMKKILVLGLMLVISAVLGIGVGIYRIVNWSKEDATIVNGVWQANKEMDLGNDKLLTARVAFAALFALKPSEVIYMVADLDSDGNKLQSEYNYVLTGIPIPSRYWSITLYGNDYFLVPNEEKCYSFNKDNLTAGGDSTFSIQISAQPKPGNWLPSGREDQFYLLLRMYHPDSVLYRNLQEIELPEIRRVK